MVFVKVRETYDLHTVKNKMTVIGIHTPRPGILKRNFPGLLMQCRAYRPVSADVRVACASVLPLDPRGVGTSTDDVAPEDVFNPILYKAMSNLGMSQLEARINAMAGIQPTAGTDVYGDTALADVDSLTDMADEFPVYYGLLSQSGVWRHANPQAGLEMKGLKPLVYELVYNMNDQIAPGTSGTPPTGTSFPGADSEAQFSGIGLQSIRGKAKPMPFINTTAYSRHTEGGQLKDISAPGFSGTGVEQAEEIIPYLTVMCGCIIIPPSRLHELFYRMVVEWTIEFSSIRPLGEITSFGGLSALGNVTHFQNYNYSATKKAVTGDDESLLADDQSMVSANVEVTKVM